jgi:hypothetical protein
MIIIFDIYIAKINIMIKCASQNIITLKLFYEYKQDYIDYMLYIKGFFKIISLHELIS